MYEYSAAYIDRAAVFPYTQTYSPNTLDAVCHYYEFSRRGVFRGSIFGWLKRWISSRISSGYIEYDTLTDVCGARVNARRCTRHVVALSPNSRLVYLNISQVDAAYLCRVTRHVSSQFTRRIDRSIPLNQPNPA